MREIKGTKLMNQFNLFTPRLRSFALAVLSTACWSGVSPTVHANPPAPYNLLYGVVRDKYGTPLTSASAQIVLQTPGGAVLSTPVIPGYAPGVNYRLKVPMDSAQTPDLYQPKAQQASAPFKLYVVMNNTTNLPIEMTGNYALLGQPGAVARFDLTLGVDGNGDGIPDSWELAFLATIGLNVPLSALNANSVLTPDGLTLRQQYLFGTYPFNPSQPCEVTFVDFNGTSPHLQFPTMTGRYYSVLASTDTKHWSTVNFSLPGDSAGTTRSYYYAPGITTQDVYVAPPANTGKALFYRVLVQ